METRPFFQKNTQQFHANSPQKIDGLQCEIQWLNLFAPWGTQPYIEGA